MKIARVASFAAGLWFAACGASIAQPAAQSPLPAPAVQGAAVSANPQDAQALRLARAQRHLERFDKDKGGYLTRSEYQRWYQATARRRSALTWKRHAANLFKRLDVNRDSKLTIEEFVADPHFRRPRMGRGSASAQ